jgi:hypothetical protein
MMVFIFRFLGVQDVSMANVRNYDFYSVIDHLVCWMAIVL